MTIPSGGRGRVHFVYPHGAAISCPDAIGRKVGDHLRRHGHEVVNYDWKDRGVIEPGPGDVLLGHAEFSPDTIFRRSLRQPGWARTVAMFPFVPGNLWHSAWCEPVVRRCDAFLAICGPVWFERMAASPFGHLLPRTRHVDLAVDRDDFPLTKGAFAPPGRRRFLYIGGTHWPKGIGFLRALAARMAPGTVGWMGTGAPMPELQAHGRMDFSSPPAREMAASYDFSITVGQADANPTTVLETMAWGLIPVCTPESGYAAPMVVNVPYGDVERALAVLDGLQQWPEPRLLAMREANLALLDAHFRWHRLCEQVRQAVEDRSPPPPLGARPLARRCVLRLGEFTSPWSPYPPMSLLRWLHRRLRSR